MICRNCTDAAEGVVRCSKCEMPVEMTPKGNAKKHPCPAGWSRTPVIKPQHCNGYCDCQHKPKGAYVRR